jgi:hypothetical protein
VREVCPEFPGGPELIHWSIPDPAREPGSNEETLPAFQRIATELHTRIAFLIEAIEQTTTSREVTEGAVRGNLRLLLSDPASSAGRLEDLSGNPIEPAGA